MGTPFVVESGHSAATYFASLADGPLLYPLIRIIQLGPGECGNVQEGAT